MISLVVEGHWGKLAIGAGLAALAAQSGAEHYKPKLASQEQETEEAEKKHGAVLKKLHTAHDIQQKIPKDDPERQKRALARITHHEKAREVAKGKLDVAQEKQKSLESKKKWLGRGAVIGALGAGAATAKKAMPPKEEMQKKEGETQRVASGI